MKVFTLLGAQNFEVSVSCLKSFVRNYQDNFRLFCYSDGTLTIDHQRQLERIRQTEVILKHPNPDAVMEVLDANPHLRTKYETSNFFKKLVDIPLLSPEGWSYLDSDIYFFLPFRGLFQQQIEYPTMAEDVAITPNIFDMLAWNRPLHGNTNAGILEGISMDYALIERFLAQSREKRDFLLEQASWQVAWGSGPIRLVHRESVKIAKRYEELPADLSEGRLPIAFHMTSYRKKYIKRLEAIFVPESSEVRDVAISIQNPRLPITECLRKVWRRVIRVA